MRRRVLYDNTCSSVIGLNEGSLVFAYRKDAPPENIPSPSSRYLRIMEYRDGLLFRGGEGYSHPRHDPGRESLRAELTDLVCAMFTKMAENDAMRVRPQLYAIDDKVALMEETWISQKLSTSQMRIGNPTITTSSGFM